MPPTCEASTHGVHRMSFGRGWTPERQQLNGLRAGIDRTLIRTPRVKWTFPPSLVNEVPLHKQANHSLQQWELGPQPTEESWPSLVTYTKLHSNGDNLNSLPSEGCRGGFVRDEKLQVCPRSQLSSYPPPEGLSPLPLPRGDSFRLPFAGDASSTFCIHLIATLY